MSRTIRRNKKALIHDACGTLDAALRERPYYAYWKPELSNEQAWVRRCRWFTSDSYDGIWYASPPRWYLDQVFTRPNRRESKRELRRCLMQDCWDDHLDPGYKHGAGYHYW